MDLPGPATSITAGDSHACAIVDGPGSEPDVYCWGSDVAGQVGDGNAPHPVCDDCVATPARVSRSRITRTDDVAAEPVEVVAGAQHTCMLLETGRVYCWGSNAHNELGAIGCGAASCTAPETAILLAYATIASGHHHVCGRSPGGEVSCWGDNSYLQLGLAVQSAGVGGAVEVPSVSNAFGLSGGLGHTCAISSGRQVQCWGNNTLGQIGSVLTDTESCASATCTDVPTTVFLAGPAFGLSAGASHSCAVVRPAAPIIDCWGANASGQVTGDGEASATSGVRSVEF